VGREKQRYDDENFNAQEKLKWVGEEAVGKAIFPTQSQEKNTNSPGP
jgi:hypothetical protein